jgi:Sec-independent protein secretion pathway component TatC
VELPLELLENTYICEDRWLYVLVMVSGVLWLVGLTGTLLNYFIMSPDILKFVSSLTRDNPHIPTAVAGTVLDGFERTRLLEDLRVRLGDVQP